MKESHYIKTENLTLLRAMATLSRDILKGIEYGIDNKKYHEMNRLISDLSDGVRESMPRLEEG